jgi:hypothetical protein
MSSAREKFGRAPNFGLCNHCRLEQEGAMMVFRISFQRGNIAPRTLFDEPRQVVLQKLKGRPSLGIEGETSSPSRTKSSSSEASAWATPEKRLLRTFWLREKQYDLCVTLHCNAAITIEFDLKGPLIIFRQCRDRLALHRLNERRFCALLNCLVFRRLCLRLLDISRRAELKRPD